MLAHNLATDETLQWHSPHVRQSIQEGLPYTDFETLRSAFGIPAERLAKAVGIHPRTLQRRRREGHFTFVESDRMYRFIELFRSAADALESKSAAASWLTRPGDRFDGLAPLEFAATEPGYQEMRDIITNIEDCAFG